MRLLLSNLSFLSMLLALSTATPASAGDRLLATGGVQQIEGAAGGGLTPWALISGYGTDDQIGASAFYTTARTRGGFTLDSGGIALGLYNRVELSASQLKFGLSDTVRGEDIRLNTVGIKLRLFGDAVYEQDTWVPQVAVGAQYKYNEDYNFVPRALGAEQRSGVDYYLAASKVILGAINGYNLIVNANLQATKANQFGILGFAGDKRDDYSLLPSGSIAVMLDDDLLLGTEYRAKPDNLRIYKEDDAHDIFVTWFPHKRLSITGAFVDLGNIANKDNQSSWYLSGQISF